MDTQATGFRIFDSMDRPASRLAESAADLSRACDELNREAEDDGTGLSYAIGKVLPCGGVTFEH